jgi:hypothetical protein
MKAQTAKYQFCIRFDSVDVNSAASKAVLDCNAVFLQKGYKDLTFNVADNSNRLWYYILLVKNMLRFFLVVRRGSIVGIQYPLLSINNIFKYFIKLAGVKGIKFFCIIHDLGSLRNGGKDASLIRKEIINLKFYDCVIAHNDQMIKWLKSNGLTTKIISLEVFDYLSPAFKPSEKKYEDKVIVYAGNLAKSKFVYSLPEIKHWHFNIYGPNFMTYKAIKSTSVQWNGEFSPEEIAQRLNGNFGLIWDGNHIDKCDEVLGNYLLYNNPHKFSLYIAAALPVIAPKSSAIGSMITDLNIGILVDNLYELEQVNIDEYNYTTMRNNILKLREKIIAGEFFKRAILAAETIINGDNTPEEFQYVSKALRKKEPA